MTTEQSPAGRKWGRRIGYTFVLLILFLIGGHYLAGWRNARDVSNRIAALQAAGEPILRADFATPNYFDADNAAVDMLAAAKLVHSDSPAWETFLDGDIGIPLSPDARSALETLVAENTAALERFAEARTKPRAIWKYDTAVPMHMLENGLTESRDLANLLAADALLAHLKGDDRLAVERLKDLVQVSRAVDTYPSLIGHLVSIGVLAVASDRTGMIAADLKIGDDAGEVSALEVRALVDLLLDDGPPNAGMARSMRGERMYQQEVMATPFIMGATPGVPPAPPPRGMGIQMYLMKPILENNKRVMLEHMASMIDIAEGNTLRSVTARLPQQRGRSWSTVYADILLPSLERAYETHFRLTTDRRLAAIALAIRSYASEHEGRLPESLEDLVPKYLPYVPGDPLAKVDAPIRYLPSGDRPMIYSTGVDGADDGGSVAPVRPGMQIQDNRYNWKDFVLDLKRQPRN